MRTGAAIHNNRWKLLMNGVSRLVLIGLLLVVAGLAIVMVSPPGRQQPTADAELEQLLVAMRQRLAVMPEVARWKWNAGVAVNDPIRERQLLDEISQKAKAVGVPAEFAMRFFTAQFEAAKQVQITEQRLFSIDHPGRFRQVIDLQRVIRPEIDRLNGELIQLLRNLIKPGHGSQQRLNLLASRILVGPGITAEVRSLAIQPLLTKP